MSSPIHAKKLHTKPNKIFKVAIQADTIGSRLKEVQDKAQNLATFGNTLGHLCEALF
jgi:hypothetical protein